jgi:anaerobic magnesium-protoporphyrin IX monomethyl ester cyclase
LPGTKFHERVQKDLREKTNWTDSDDLDLMFRGTYAPEFYRALYRLVHSEFRLRKEISRFPHPGAIARSMKHFAGHVAARLAVESHSRRRNPALP